MFEHGWQPLAYGTIRYFVAIALFWGFTYWRERSFRIARKRRAGSSLIAAPMIFLNQLCFVYSIEARACLDGGALLGTTPIFIGLISLVLRLEQLPRRVLDRCRRSRSAAWR